MGWIMLALHENYVVNTVGEKTGVILGYDEWLKVLDVLEEYEDILAYDSAKSAPSLPISFDDAIKTLK